MIQSALVIRIKKYLVISDLSVKHKLVGSHQLEVLACSVSIDYDVKS